MAKGKKRRVVYARIGRAQKKQIREFAKFIPNLEKYVGKDKLTPAQMAVVTRAKKKLRHTEDLRPVTEKQAKKLKGKLAGGGIRAVRLRNTSPNAKISIRKGGMIVTSNGREFEYHPVTPDIDSLIEAGERLFNRPRKTPFALYLWQDKGRMDRGFTSLPQWTQYVIAIWQAYGDADEFIKGIAALVRDEKGKYRNP